MVSKARTVSSVFIPSLSPVLEAVSGRSGESSPQRSDPQESSTLDGGSPPNTNAEPSAPPKPSSRKPPRKKMAKKGAKAKKMMTCISGIKGKHPIQTAVAYWYRGHYIYGPAFNPIQPVPFATKEIHIIGTTAETAPAYDPHDVDLKWEFELLSLHKSMWNEWENIMQEKAAEAAGKAAAEQDASPEDAQAKTQDAAQTDKHEPQEPFMTMPGESASTESATAFPVFDNFYNDQAMYLASSAPVSQHGTPSRSNTPVAYGSRPQTPLHQTSAFGSSVSGLRSVSSMARVDQLMVEHGIKRSIATLQHAAPWLLNESAVAAATNFVRQNPTEARPATLSRIPSIARESPDVPAGSTPYPISAPPSRVPSMTADSNEIPGSLSRPVSRTISRVQSFASLHDASTNENAFKTVSVPISRVPSVPSQLHEGSSSRAYPTLPGLGPKPVTHAESSGNILRPSSVTTYSTPSAGPSFQKASYPPSRPESRLAGTPLDFAPVKRPSPPHLSFPAQSSAPGTRTSTPALLSRPVSRIPSSTYLAADDVFGGSSAGLSRSRSTLSLLGDDYNGHHSRFFPMQPLHSPVNTGRPRKDSMAKASRALNEAYNRSRSNTAIYDPRGQNPGVEESAIAPSAEEPGSDGEKESGGRGLLKCALHGEDCDGETTTTLHQTENARRYRGIVEPVPMLKSKGREMVDWALLLQETKKEMGL